MTGPGLYHTAEAPLDFKAWLEKVLADWDFDNMCCAHVENKIGNAHTALKKALEEADKTLLKLSEKSKDGKRKPEPEKTKAKDLECSKYNVSGNECG